MIQSSLPRSAIKKFQKSIWDYYGKKGRTFPWRDTKDPYQIFVSEIMLQQTQTERVIPKFQEFLVQFPSWRTLAKSPLGKVLAAWSGLGYNRRAKHLHEAARRIVRLYDSRLPSELKLLKDLPGIGEYTAQAILAFVFNKRALCIETNIRAVYLSRFFSQKKSVSDVELKKIIELTLPDQNYREWYYALMDMGASLKKQDSKLTQRSKHYKKQSPFKGSTRQIRGHIMRELICNRRLNIPVIALKFKKNTKEVQTIIESLVNEKLIKKIGRTFLLP